MSSDLRWLKGEAKVSTEMKNNSKRHQITTKWDKMSTAGKKTCLMSLVSEAVKDKEMLDAFCMQRDTQWLQWDAKWLERHEKATGMKNVNKTTLRCNKTWLYNCQMIKKGRQTNKCKRTDSKWARKGSQWQQGSNKRLLDSYMISIHQKKKITKWMKNECQIMSEKTCKIHMASIIWHKIPIEAQDDHKKTKGMQNDHKQMRTDSQIM